MGVWKVELSPADLLEIKTTAQARNQTNRGASNPDGAVIDSVEADETGCIGEKALSLVLDKAWDGKHFSFEDWLKWRLIGGDVSGIEGKCTLHKRGRLWLRPEGVWHPDRPYVLLRAHDLPIVEAAGWAFGKDIHQEYNLEEGKHNRPCYYLENYELYPMEDLIKLIEDKLC